MAKGQPVQAPRAQGERVRVAKKRIAGQLIQWKGKYGWILPTQPIQHPDAEKKGGKIYVGVEDIEGPELTNKCMVTFICYSDGDGLGAMHCKAAPHLQGPAQAGSNGGVIRTIGKKGGSDMAKGGGGKALGKAAGRLGGKAAGKGPLAKGARMQPQAKGKVAARPKNKTGAKTELDQAEDGASREGKERTPPPPPDQSARERIIKKRLIGKLIRWRGEIGWIKPNDKIDHPEAVKHRKGLYLHEVDVQPGHDLFQGAQVSFFVYADGDGLGAEHVMITKEQPVKEDVLSPKAAKGKGKGKDKGKGKGNAGEKLTMVQKLKLKRKRGKRSGEKGEKVEKGEKTKGGPDLPRNRVTVLPVSGEVASWKGKFGWLSPSEDFEHEMASKHDGKIYLHEKDILDGAAPLSVGQSVEFHVYVDQSGLGAEEAICSAAAST